MCVRACNRAVRATTVTVFGTVTETVTDRMVGLIYRHYMSAKFSELVKLSGILNVITSTTVSM